MKAGDIWIKKDTGARIRIVMVDERAVDFVFENDTSGRVLWALREYFTDSFEPDGCSEADVQRVLDTTCASCRVAVEEPLREFIRKRCY